MSDLSRYPLCWPDNVPRRAPQQRGVPQFAPKTVADATAFVLAEINRLNRMPHFHRDENVIVSSNLRLRLDGLPRSGDGEPSDPAVAVYFQLRFKQSGKDVSRHCVLTCDRWVRVSWNLYAIGKDIEAQRARERWGCTSVEQAFRGYLAIPERCGGPAWWDVLGVAPAAGRPEIEAAFTRLAKSLHPDAGGDHESWVRLQAAYGQALARFKE